MADNSETEPYRDSARSGGARNPYRAAVGGLWETLGPLVADYLQAQGLRRDQRVLDVGCGCLRIGVRLIERLDPGNYFGVDISQEMLDAGYDIELAALGLRDRLPRENLVRTGEFDFRTLIPSAPFDVALAQSLFTHLPIGHLRLCLGRLAPIMRPGGVFHATFFIVPELGAWLEPARHEPGGITTHPVRDPYHHTWDDIVAAAAGLPWTVTGPHDIAHPRAQLMVRFTRMRSPGSD